MPPASSGSGATTLFASGRQIGIYRSTFAGGDRETRFIALENASALGTDGDIYRITVDPVEGNAFRDGQTVSIATLEGAIVMPPTIARTAPGDGLLADPHHIVFLDPMVVIDLRGLPRPADAVVYDQASVPGGPSDTGPSFSDFGCGIAR